jgi:lambda repressor-like predicted transcriptional regulator
MSVIWDMSGDSEDMDQRTSSTDLHPELVKARIRMAHGSLLAFEQAHGLPPYSVRDVLRGRSVRRTGQAVAGFLGVTLEELRAACIAASHTSHDRDTHRLNREAA